MGGVGDNAVSLSEREQLEVSRLHSMMLGERVEMVREAVERAFPRHTVINRNVPERPSSRYVDLAKLPVPVGSVVEAIVKTFTAKSADYASQGWRSNFDAVAAQVGLSAWKAAEVLIAVKQARLASLTASGKEPRNESVDDTLLDRAVYSILAAALRKDDRDDGTVPKE